MGKWIVPTPSVGASFANEISLAGSRAVTKFSIRAEKGYFTIGTTKGTVYSAGNKGVIFYILPDLSDVIDSRVFQPMRIHSVQFEWNQAGVPSGDLEIWTATSPTTGWNERWNSLVDASGQVGLYTVNLAAYGITDRIIAFVFDASGSTETGETDANMFIIKNIILYTYRDPVITNKLTGDKIVKDLLIGNSDVGIVAHADQVSSDMLFVEKSDLELVPIIYEGETIQSIISKITAPGLGTVHNYIQNPSHETPEVRAESVDFNGWVRSDGLTSIVYDTDVPVDVGAGTYSIKCLIPATDGAGWKIGRYAKFVGVRGNNQRLNCEPNQTYSFSIYSRATAVRNMK